MIPQETIQNGDLTYVYVHVDQDTVNTAEQSEVPSSSGWNVTSRMVIEFYEENRVLWDRNHKDRKNSIQKKLFTPLVVYIRRALVVLSSVHKSRYKGPNNTQ